MSALPVGRVFAQEFFPGLEIPIIDAHAHLPGELSSDFEGYTFQAIRGAKMCATSMAVIGDNLIGNDMQRHGSDDKDDTGLTEFGCQVVRRMNRLGIIVDVSHASTQTLLDVAACTRAPIVDSHTSMLPPKVTVRAGSRQRLYSDAEAIVDTGGVVCTYPYGDDANGRTTLNDWVKEIKLSKSHFGMRHIGFGSDSGGGVPRMAAWTGIGSVSAIQTAARRPGSPTAPRAADAPV